MGVLLFRETTISQKDQDIEKRAPSKIQMLVASSLGEATAVRQTCIDHTQLNHRKEFKQLVLVDPKFRQRLETGPKPQTL